MIEQNNPIDPEPVVEPEKRKGKKWLWAAGAGLVVLVLGAAFFAGRLLNGGTAKTFGNGQMVFSSSGPGNQTVSMELVNSPDLPERQADKMGVFVRREDKSIFVGTGNVTVGISMQDGGASDVSADYDGPVVEVVVTHDTQIFQDVTDIAFDNAPADGKITQVVKPGSLDDLKTNSVVQVWGQMQGDRIVAEVLSFR